MSARLSTVLPLACSGALCDLHIGGFQVAMDHAPIMGVFESLGHLPGKANRFEREFLAPQVGLEPANPSVNSRTACSRLALQPQDLDAPKSDFLVNGGTLGVLSAI
jgi:hypothetical protein